MTGRIPPYGKNFRREPLDYSPDMANRRYVLKMDARYYTRSDKTSKVWHLFGPLGESGKPATSLTTAMTAILAHRSAQIAGYLAGNHPY